MAFAATGAEGTSGAVDYALTGSYTTSCSGDVVCITRTYDYSGTASCQRNCTGAPSSGSFTIRLSWSGEHPPALIEPAPKGLILHVARRTEEGFWIIDVWESKRAWEDFRAQRLAPAIAALGVPSRPKPTFRDLHPAHVVVGARTRLESIALRTEEQ